MKKRLFVILVLLLTVLTTCLAGACVGTGAKSYELAGYDFSYDNVLEIGYIASISDDGGTPYGNTIYRLQKGRSQEDDEIIRSVAKAWHNMQEGATFKRQKKFNVLIACGGAGEVVCVFNDGSKVRMHKDEVGNFKINNGKSCRLSEEDMKYYSNLRDAYGAMIVPQNRVLSISQAAMSNAKLKSCDFSLSNVAALVLSNGCPTATYSIRKGHSAQGDEVISQALEYWNAFQQQAVFNDNIYGKDHAIDGGSAKFKCTFVDGTYISIGFDDCTNYVVNEFGPCQLEESDLYKYLNEIRFLMEKAEYLIN